MTGALPFHRYWLASGDGLGAQQSAIDPPPWPLNAIPTKVIATDDEAMHALAAHHPIDARGKSLDELLAILPAPEKGAGYFQIVDTAVLDFLPGLEQLAEQLKTATPSIVRASVMRIETARIAVEDISEALAAFWIRADRFGDLAAEQETLARRVAALCASVTDLFDGQIVTGGYCQTSAEPGQAELEHARKAAAISKADRERYLQRKAQWERRKAREAERMAKPAVARPRKCSFLSRLFRR